jgi:hypothetical protein
MGYFLALTAIRDAPPPRVADAIRASVERHGVRLTPAEGDTNDARDLHAYEAGAWTIVLWPEYFNIHDLPLAEILSRDLSTIVSTVHVYDDEYWTHGLFQDGRLVDRFASRPRFFADEPEAPQVDPSEWGGDAEAIARTLGIAPDPIAGYLVHLDGPAARTGRVNADDAAPIEEFWVFVDFWRALGIDYPADMSSMVASWRLSPGFNSRLPVFEAL